VKRAAIYTRISRDRIGAGLGVQRQEQDCRELVRGQGWTVAAVHTDNDLSAYSGKPRPGYRQMLDDIEAGLVDVVVAWHTDRLHRSPVELEDYIAISDRRGIPTHSVKAGPLDLATPSGRLVARQLGAVARYEVEHAIERQKRSKDQAAAAGEWKGGRRPFGYEADGVTVRPPEAAIVSDATDAILAGDSLRSIAAGLNARGILTSTGRPWKPTELRRVLQRPRNAGLMEHRGKVVGKARWPALVDENRWRAVNSILNDPARRTSTSSARRWMLSGVATCGICDGPIICSRSSARRNTGASYVCREFKHVVRVASELDSYISDIVVERLSRPDAAGLLTVGTPDEAADRLRAADALRERLDALAVAFADGQIDARQLAAGSQRLRADLDKLEADIAEAGTGTVLAELAPGTPGVEERWLALPVSRQSAITDALLTVVLNKSSRGRRPGWRPGESYFDPRSVEVTPKSFE
jgi:site-specific DNA recombinase